jgi:hypothetical protein
LAKAVLAANLFYGPIRLQSATPQNCRCNEEYQNGGGEDESRSHRYLLSADTPVRPLSACAAKNLAAPIDPFSLFDICVQKPRPAIERRRCG